MIKRAFLPLSVLVFMLTACGDNIHPESDSVGDDDGECIGGDCPSDQPDAGTPTPDADTGGGTDAGTVGGADGGTGGGSDGGTDGGTDGGGTDAGTCGTCPEGQVCVEGACVCDHDGDPSEGGCAPDEVLLCHVPPGNTTASHDICVGAGAAQAHLGHGDTLGACP